MTSFHHKQQTAKELVCESNNLTGLAGYARPKKKMYIGHTLGLPQYAVCGSNMMIQVAAGFQNNSVTYLGTLLPLTTKH